MIQMKWRIKKAPTNNKSTQASRDHRAVYVGDTNKQVMRVQSHAHSSERRAWAEHQHWGPLHGGSAALPPPPPPQHHSSPADGGSSSSTAALQQPRRNDALRAVQQPAPLFGASSAAGPTVRGFESSAPPPPQHHPSSPADGGSSSSTAALQQPCRNDALRAVQQTAPLLGASKDAMIPRGLDSSAPPPPQHHPSSPADGGSSSSTAALQQPRRNDALRAAQQPAPLLGASKGALTPYEMERQANIQRNEEVLLSLGLVPDPEEKVAQQYRRVLKRTKKEIDMAPLHRAAKPGAPLTHAR